MLNWLLKFQLQMAQREMLNAKADLDFMRSLVTGAASDKEVLARLIEAHQDLLPDHRMQGVVDQLPVEVSGTPEVAFCQAVAYYDKQHKETKKDWETCLKLFAAINAGENKLLEFYKQNYCFLSGRNAGSTYYAQLDFYYLVAYQLAKQFEPRLQHRLLGFLVYNLARHRLQNEKKVDEARQLYIEATQMRLAYFQDITTDLEATPEARKSAAIQLWKCRNDYTGLFKEEVPVEFPVNEARQQMLNDEYEIDASFSAVKK